MSTTIARGLTVTNAGENTAEAFGVTPVNKVKRVHERGRYDRKTVYEILDAALVCHIAYVIDGRPYCTPTWFWREGDHLYWHGSSASRMIRTQGQGVAGLPHRHPSRRAGDGAVGLPPFGQLPRRDGVRHGAHHRRRGEEAEADGPLHRPHLSRPLEADPPAQHAGVQGDDHDGHGDRARLGQDPRQARRRRGGGLRGRPRLVRALSGDADHRRAVGVRAPDPRPRAARRAWPTSSPARASTS